MKNHFDESGLKFRFHVLLLLLSLICLHLNSENFQTSAYAYNDVDNNDIIVNQNEENNVLSNDNLAKLLTTSLFGTSIDNINTNNNDETEDTFDGIRQARKRSNEIYLLEDKDYPKSLFESYLGVGQVSGIATLPSDDVAIFHRSTREWTNNTFDISNSVADVANAQDNLIKNDTIMIIDREDGSAITTFGANLFYMPHSIASDNRGNLWVTDVGRHQVMRLPTSMMQLEQHLDRSGKPGKGKSAKNLVLPGKHRWLPGNLTRIWPDIILGEAFVPGIDEAHFCKPSEVAVSSDGRLVFIADGYCNKRVMVFTGTGKYITSFGKNQSFNVVHSLTLIEERNLVCVADRENGRIHCYKAGLNGDLESLGDLVLTVNYPIGRVFAIESISASHMLVASNQPGSSRFDLAALNPFTSELKQTWTSSDLLAPHSLARTKNGRFVYAADVSKEAYKKVFKFDVIERKF